MTNRLAASSANLGTHPMLKKFRTQDHCYIYDAKSNRILRVSPAMYDIVDVFGEKTQAEIHLCLANSYSDMEIRQTFETIAAIADKYHLFGVGPLRRRVGHVTKEAVAETLKAGITSITLELTEACNLRCRYCIYSGGYSNWRTHGSRQMSEATAFAALDLYLDNSPNSDILMVSFYGGEPLLGYELIKRCCEYVKHKERERGKCRKLHFSMTTNGTLLTQEWLRFLAENDFALSISLDGPKEIHDRNRVFQGGNGTFDTVFGNIRAIFREQEEYARRKLHFNCTVTPNANLKRLAEFFGDYSDLFTGRLLLASLVSGNVAFFQNNLPYPGRNDDWAELYRSYIRAHIPGLSNPDHLNPLIRAMFERDHLILYKRQVFDQGQDHLDRINSCFPGARKLFVDVDGKLHICERIDRHFPIGDVRSGFDIERMACVMNEFIDVMDSEVCRSCWAVQLCNICYSAAKGGAFPPHALFEECARYRKRTENTLQAHCTILDKNPHAFDYMESYALS